MTARWAWLVASTCIAACGDAAAPTDAGGDRDGGTAVDSGAADAHVAVDSGARDSGAPTGIRGGPVRLVGRELRDDGGPFVALGASLFWATWGYHEDRPRLERNLAWLRDHHFDYIRVLGVVGDPANPDSWDGREADWHWPDYDATIAGLTDLAWQTYGLRVEWTLIGDGQLAIPNESDRYALVDRFVAMARPRAHEIIYFEIANEGWKNGFDGDPGNTQLRSLARYMRDGTDVLVAASSPVSTACAEIVRVYGAPGEVADLATMHFDRDTSRAEGSWGPVWQPSVLADCGAWVGSNDEPIGPGSSVAMETDPMHLAAAPLTTWVAGLPFHVFHSRAGVRGDFDVSEMPGADSFGSVHGLVPADLPGWDRRRGDESDAPLRVFAEDGTGALVGDATWMDIASPRSGVVRFFGALRGSDFVVVPIGILGAPTVEARRALSFDAFDPLTGALVAHHDLAAGERTTLSGAEALVLRGVFR